MSVYKARVRLKDILLLGVLAVLVVYGASSLSIFSNQTVVFNSNVYNTSVVVPAGKMVDKYTLSVAMNSNTLSSKTYSFSGGSNGAGGNDYYGIIIYTHVKMYLRQVDMDGAGADSVMVYTYPSPNLVCTLSKSADHGTSSSYTSSNCLLHANVEYLIVRNYRDQDRTWHYLSSPSDGVFTTKYGYYCSNLASSDSSCLAQSSVYVDDIIYQPVITPKDLTIKLGNLSVYHGSGYEPYGQVLSFSLYQKINQLCGRNEGNRDECIVPLTFTSSQIGSSITLNDDYELKDMPAPVQKKEDNDRENTQLQNNKIYQYHYTQQIGHNYYNYHNSRYNVYAQDHRLGALKSFREGITKRLHQLIAMFSHQNNKNNTEDIRSSSSQSYLRTPKICEIIKIPGVCKV